MSDLGSSNNLNESKEQNNIIKNTQSLEGKLIRGFVEEKVSNKRNKINFIENIIKSDSIDSDLKAELENYGDNFSEFDGIDYDKLKISWLQREIRSSLVELQNKKDKIKESFLKEYNISSKDFDNKIFKEIKLLNDIKLTELLNSTKNRQKLLKKIYGKNNVPQTRTFLNTFKDLNFTNRIEKKLKNLKGQEKQDLIDIANRFSSLQKMDLVDIQTLFELDFFTIQEKKEIINTFLPNISIDNAINLGILTREQADKYKKDYVKQVFFDNKNIGEDNIKLISDKLDNREIYLSTDKYIIDESDINNILTDEDLSYKIGANISGDYKKTLEEIEQLKKEKEIEKGGKTLSGFQERLKQLPNVKNPENFKSGNVIIIKTSEIIQGEGGTNELKNIFFLDIENDGDGKGEIEFINRGESIYNSNKEHFKRTYSNIEDFIKNGNRKNKLSVESFEIITKEDLKQKVFSGQIKEIVDEIELDDIETIKEKKEKLENQLLKTREELLREGIKEDELKDNSKYSNLLNQIENIEEYNLEYLEKVISDEVDSGGKEFGIRDNVTFETKEGGIYTIANVNVIKNEITIISALGIVENPISFEDFFKIFKEKEGKRKSNAKDFKGVFDSVSKSSDWSDFELKGDSIQKKDTDNKINYDYLVSKEDEEVLKIENISGGYIKVTFGEYKEEIVEDKKGNEKTKKMYSMDNSSMIITPGTLETLIKRWNLVPRSVDEDKDIKKDKIDIPNIKGSFFSRLFNNMSISELIAGGKVWIDSIENYLKEGNEEHAAKFASSVLGKFLPKELKRDLKTRVEQAGKKRMDDYVEKLKSVDSGIATGMIETRLLNRDVPQYKLEAAAIFMMDKYGTLYAKGPLYKYKGSMLWYKAFGGTVNDELYNDQKKEHEDYGVNFTEEHLVFMLIKRQCKPEGYNGISRRTRLHKEYKAVRNKAKEAEWDKGKTDASSRRTIESRFDYAKGELEGGTYPNAMGALEAVFGKGGDYTLMNALPIIMSFSGTGYYMDEDTLDKLKNKILAGGMMLPVSALLSKRAHMDIFNDTILELSKDLEELYPEDCSGMASMAEEIYRHRFDTNHKGDEKAPGQWNEPKKLEKTLDFYKKYGEPLSRSLNQLNTGKHKFSKSDKILTIRKDDYYDEKTGKIEKGKKIYKDYLDLQWMMVDDLGTYTNEDYMMQSAVNLGTSGISVYKATKEVLYQDQGGGFRNKNIGPMIWREIYTQIDAIVNGEIVYVENNPAEDRKVKEKILKGMLRGLLSGLLETHGTKAVALYSLNKPTSPFASRFNKWGIKTKEIAGYSLSAERMLDETDIDANNLLNRYVDNMLSGKDVSGIDIDDVIENTENAVANISKHNKSDDYDLQKVA